MSFKAKDGKTVSDGKKMTLRIAKGEDKPVTQPDGRVLEHGDYAELELTGIVRKFEHVDRVYDEEGIAIAKTSEEKWEISTDDPQHPAIGFRPENVLTASEA